MKCTKCKVDKEEQEFNLRPNKTRRRDCKTCQAKKIRECRLKNIREKTDYLNVILRDGCSICGETRPYTLDFHHLGNKEHSISKLRGGTGSLSTLKEEVVKCVVVCSNCHREIHYFKRNGE